MNSPYNGRFKITQNYKGDAHRGIDLVGIDSKEIHATVTGTVEIARWENVNNPKQGFGQYVMIREDNGNRCFIYAHLSKILTSSGKHVRNGEVIGIEGDTGYSFGSHCHYEVRYGNVSGYSMNINEISGIPNDEGNIYDDGYRETSSKKTIDEIAKEIINDTNNQKWGTTDTNPTRQQRLESAGYNYQQVQDRVNELLGIKKTTNTIKKLYLPAYANSWRVYPLDKAPYIGNECGFLRPSKFGGLTYDIIRYINDYVVVIKTRDFGTVQIYVAPDTGAVIK